MYSQSDQQTASTAATGKSRDRRCFVTYVRKPTDELVRFVVAPDNSIVPDLAERLPGRGLWLSSSRETVNTACAKRLFAKAAGGSVTVRDDLADAIEEQLHKRCLDLLGMARRAGEAVDDCRGVVAGGATDCGGTDAARRGDLRLGRRQDDLFVFVGRERD